jgi:hypothetical protein
MTSQEEQERKELLELLDFTDAKKSIILNNIVKTQTLYNPIDVSDDVYKDTGIDTWASSLPVLDGSKVLIQQLIKCPINNRGLLEARQNAYKSLTESIDFSILKDYEDDVLWIYKLNEEVKSNNLINVLFPSAYIVSYINYVEPLLELYHMYKIYFIPLNIIAYPILSLFAPLYYVNRYLGFSISMQSYFSILGKIVKFMFTFTGNIKAVLIKIVSIAFYLFLFGYNIYQTFEYSYMLYSVKSTLYKKISNLNIFLQEAQKILPVDISSFVKNIAQEFGITTITNNFPSIYKIWKDPSIKTQISNLLVTVYTVDIINSMSNLLKKSANNDWSLVSYVQGAEKSTKIWNMKNPVLSLTQKANPLDMRKNIIVTGPNAAGKTTYVKSILSNVILAQTFGIAYGLKAESILYDNIASFMRVSDVLGSKSYFEAEAEYCKKMMEKAKRLSETGKRGLFLMDEPMHSTPPTEGMATAYAVAEYIGKLPGATIILTTHFHKLVLLERAYPQHFINLSVEAIPKSSGFTFPYTIRCGHSYQCIAIELLSSKEFPVEVIKSAINMKNKICAEIVDKDVLL